MFASIPVKSTKAEQQYQHGIINVEAIRDERQNAHGAHNLTEVEETRNAIMYLGLDFLISTLNQCDRVLQDFKKSFISVIVPANVQKECALNVACVFLCDTHRDIGRLYSVLGRDGRVHMNQAQEVEAQRRSQTTQQPEGTKKRSNLIS